MKERKHRNREVARLVSDETFRRWAIERGTTPQERYKLGPTNTWHPAMKYLKEIMPLWCPDSVAWPVDCPFKMPSTTFVTICYGGLIDTSYVPMHNVYTGKTTRLYVRDSAKTRSLIEQIQAEPTRFMAWRMVKVRLVTETFEEGWLKIFSQVQILRRKLEKPDWQLWVTGRTINLAEHVSFGKIMDAGLMPPELLIYALRLIVAFMTDYITNSHSSSGFIETKNGKKRRILIVWGHHQIIRHQQVKSLQFYRSNIHLAPSTTKPVNRLRSI